MLSVRSLTANSGQSLMANECRLADEVVIARIAHMHRAFGRCYRLQLPGRRLFDSEQFDFEYERSTARDRALPAVTVGGIRGAPEFAFATNHHFLHALCPARDYAV